MRNLGVSQPIFISLKLRRACKSGKARDGMGNHGPRRDPSHHYFGKSPIAWSTGTWDKTLQSPLSLCPPTYTLLGVHMYLFAYGVNY